MSGLTKPKEYDWKDSNMALFGSDTEKRVKKESAESEPAWQGSGQEPGLQIWRIEKFEVKEWPKEDYGKFFNGDSYIILHTYKEPDQNEFKYDVHFWIGRYSTQDEYGTAAYKTVELDTLLDYRPVQHREVEGHESSLFKSYFKTIVLMTGGHASGFKHVRPETYKPRLFHVRRGENDTVELKEVARSKDALNSGDVFILDNGLILYMWIGKDSNKDERYRGTQFMAELQSERNGKPKSEVLDEGSIPPGHPFYDLLDEEMEPFESGGAADSTHVLFKVSDEDGSLRRDYVKDGPLSRDDLQSTDVFICDFKTEVVVWIGKEASDEEKQNGFSYAHNYLMSTDHPIVPISVEREGNESRAFLAAFLA